MNCKQFSNLSKTQNRSSLESSESPHATDRSDKNLGLTPLKLSSEDFFGPPVVARGRSGRPEPDGYGHNRIRIFPMNINESEPERVVVCVVGSVVCRSDVMPEDSFVCPVLAGKIRSMWTPW